ncbi:MAG: LysR family transcriptional regulator [Pseudomonadales bacterium]|nr:LysR family transcriptional regulator [Pseudomonadales bacterium]MBO7006990.1 LysR family transcriptional regulator [Pseudomonadales bacterium]
MADSSVDIRQLRYIVETAKARPIGAAARLWSVSPSALTRHIMGLEEHLGIQIFQRIRRINPVLASSARYPSTPKAVFSGVFEAVW